MVERPIEIAGCFYVPDKVQLVLLFLPNLNVLWVLIHLIQYSTVAEANVVLVMRPANTQKTDRERNFSHRREKEESYKKKKKVPEYLPKRFCL